ncbi:TIGR03790 family protein [Candidatus Sumerlaeota bacterium]|nr:TIGR03790 family protein [Candidatus Sumerlaeota bacterium]
MLLVYNRADPDSLAIRDHYVKARPGVMEFNLAAPKLVGRHTIPYAEFKATLRAPIRKFLISQPDLAQRIICIVLTKGIPHRIEDTNRPETGDDAAAMREEWLEKGDFTAASVDSELTLLWQDLDRGEKGGEFDSKADGFIANPYFGIHRPITDFNRGFIMTPKKFDERVKVGGESDQRQGGWDSSEARLPVARLEPGDIYLVTRLDGASREDVFAMIARARYLRPDKSKSAVILDAAARGDLDKGDYARTEAVLVKGGWRVIRDATERFITGDELTTPVLAYASYGVNDMDSEASRSPGYIRRFKFTPGAIFNTLESFNGRDFGGAGDRPGREQTQLADFINAGVTFGIGNVWEPFSFTAASNEYLLDNFLNRGMCFAEAAYSSLRVLSWQQIVVGDPLAKVNDGLQQAK